MCSVCLFFFPNQRRELYLSAKFVGNLVGAKTQCWREWGLVLSSLPLGEEVLCV